MEKDEIEESPKCLIAVRCEQKAGVDFNEAHSFALKLMSLRIQLAIANVKDMVHHPRYLKKNVFMETPENRKSKFVR